MSNEVLASGWGVSVSLCECLSHCLLCIFKVKVKVIMLSYMNSAKNLSSVLISHNVL